MSSSRVVRSVTRLRFGTPGVLPSGPDRVAGGDRGPGRARAAWLRATALVAGLLALGCGSTTTTDPLGPASPEDQKLEQVFEDYLTLLFRFSPSTATELGFHALDGELDDLSAASLAARETGLTAVLSRLAAELDPTTLSSAGRADLGILRNEVESALFSLRELKPFERDPLVYANLISGSVYSLLKRDYAPLDDRARSAISRMRKIPGLLQQARANLKSPPRPHVDVAIRQNRGAVAFYDAGLADFVKGSSLAEAAITEGKKVAEALREYQGWLESDLQPRATGDWRLGRQLWERKLRFSLDASLSPAEMRERARAEYERVRGEMLEVSRWLWTIYYPDRRVPEGPEALQETVRAVLDRVSEERSTPQTIVSDARQTITDLRIFLAGKELVTLPSPDRLHVIEMPEFQAGVSTAYLDPAPPLDPDGKSFYAIEPIPASWREEEATSRLREYNRHMLKILSIHEGYPGHYLQLEHSNRYPSKIRRVLGNGPMIEGWAVYTERMMVESGFGGNDPRLRLNQLKFYLRAIVNALIDQGLHFGELDEEAALSLLMDGAFQEKNEARGKLVRAQVTSTQLSTYFVGYQEVQGLREEVERLEGTDFSLRRFHDAFLSHGSPPVRVIREAMLGDR